MEHRLIEITLRAHRYRPVTVTKENRPMTQRYVAADPYPWPYDGDLRPANTALVIIDMQIDFCGIGGSLDRLGRAFCLPRRPNPPGPAEVRGMARQGVYRLLTPGRPRPDHATPSGNEQ